MAQIVLFKIAACHARSIQGSGFKIRHQGKDFDTGPIVGYLDPNAGQDSNLGMVDLGSKAITLSWQCIVTLPILADMFDAGLLSQDESGPVKLTFDEAGNVWRDDLGFDAVGTGSIHPGSFFSRAKILSQPNGNRVLQRGSTVMLGRDLAAGKTVHCAFIPKDSYLTLSLPKAMGGGQHQLNLTGGFSLEPIMSLGAPAKRKRGSS